MKIPGVYVEIKGDITQLRKDMKEAASIVTTSSKDMSNAINNALGPDKVSGQINKIVTNLGTLSRSSKVTGAAFDALGVDLGELTRLTGMTSTQFSSLQTRLLQTQAAKAQESALRSIATAAGLTEAEIKSLGQQFGLTNAQIDKVSGVTKSAGSSFDFFGGAVRTALSFLGVQQLIEFAGAVLKTGLQVDSLQRSFTAITGSEQGMRSEMEFLRTTADATGQNMYALAESYKQLTAATANTSMEGAKTRDLFEAMSEAGAVLGLSTDRMELSLKAFAQMASKGTVSMEELRGQLGDHLPGALNIAANAMGVTQAELQAMIKEGEVLAEDLLPAMASELHKMYSEAAQTAALESGQAAVNRLSQAWTDFKANLYDNDAAVIAINIIGTSIKYWADKLGSGKTLSGMKKELEDIQDEADKIKKALGNGDDAWLYLKFGGADEAKAELKEIGEEAEGLELSIRQMEASADPAIAKNVKAAGEITDSWLSFYEEKGAAQQRSNEIINKALEEQSAAEDKASKDAISASEKAEKAREKEAEAAAKIGVEYVSISQEIALATEAGVNFGTQLALLEKAKGIDVTSESVKKAGDAFDTAAAKAKDMGEAYRQIYDDMADSSSQFAEESLALSLKSLDAQVAGYKQAGVDEDTIRAWRLEQEKQLYQDWLTEHGSFVDGFKVGIQEMVEEISTIGEMGKETFGILSDSWKDGFYATITGDMDSLSDVWDSMLSSLLRMFSDFVAELILKWAAAEFLNIEIGVNGGSLSSGSATSIISSISSMFSSDTGGGPAALEGGSAGGDIASLAAATAASKVAESYVSTLSSSIQTGLGYVGTAAGAYGVYSGIKNISDGNVGTGSLQTGLGAVSMYKGAVAADLVAEGTATKIGESIVGYFAKEKVTEVAATKIAQTAATKSISTGATGAGGGTMAGLGAVGAFMAAVYALNTAGRVEQVSSTDYMNQTGISADALGQFTSGWTEVEDTILDISYYSTNMGQAFMDAGDNMLYYTASMGIGAQQWDAAAQQWTDISLGAGLDAQQLGASAQAASILTIDAANSIISSYTGQNLTMVEAATVANSAAAAYQDLAASESGSTTYAIQLQWELQAMGLSASDAAAAANELIAQMEAEAGASSTVADTASTATGMLGGMATAISESASAALTVSESMSSLSSTLGGFAVAAGSTADSLRKAVGSMDEAISTGGSRSAGVDGQFHSGGIIPRDGTYYMQGGEVVIPKQQASIAGATVINVYIGNEKLDSRTVKIADAVSAARQASGVSGRVYI